MRGSMWYEYAEYSLAIKLVEFGEVDVKEFISRRVKLDGAEEAFHLIEGG